MITLQPTDIYLGLAIVGIFSGLGNAIGQYVFNEIIKPKLHPHIEKIKNAKLPKDITIKDDEIIIK